MVIVKRSTYLLCASYMASPQEFGVDVQQSALLSVLPWFVTILVSNSSGWIADGLANSGRLSMTNTRKLLQTIGSVGPACALLYLATAHNNPGELEMGEAVGALTATLALGGFQSAGGALTMRSSEKERVHVWCCCLLFMHGSFMAVAGQWHGMALSQQCHGSCSVLVYWQA